MDISDFVELDIASLQHVFSFLSRNHLVLSIKPLSKHFKEHVRITQQSKADKVAASNDVPLWALPSLGVASPTYNQKKRLMLTAAKGGCLLTLKWAREEDRPWDRTISDGAAEGGRTTSENSFHTTYSYSSVWHRGIHLYTNSKNCYTKWLNGHAKPRPGRASFSDHELHHPI